MRNHRIPRCRRSPGALGAIGALRKMRQVIYHCTSAASRIFNEIEIEGTVILLTLDLRKMKQVFYHSTSAASQIFNEIKIEIVRTLIFVF
jgi:hypothetical protein